MRICKVKGCEKKYLAKGYCVKHYQQIHLYGKIFKRTKFDPNEIICKGDICEIILYDVKSNEVARAIIDKEDKSKVEDERWCLSNGYVTTSGVKKLLFLHHLILPRKKGLLIDHWDTNPLNNRKANLRYATHQQNARNTKKSKGYSWIKNAERFVAYIRVDGKNIHLGYFAKEEDAKEVRREAEIKYWDEFAPIRNIL